jgi:glycosyltransferase involved in cell wall biosynthesis
MKLKVCHMTSVHPVDDVRIFHKECVSLAENGYEVHLVARGALSSDNKGVIHHTLPISAHETRLKRMILRAYRTYRIAKNTQAAIYHFHDPELLPYGLWLKWQGKTVIYDAHEDLSRDIMTKPWIPSWIRPGLSWMIEKIEHTIAKRLDAVVTATPFIKSRFQSIGAKALDIKNYPRLSEFAGLAHVNPSDKATQTICYVGMISEERGMLEMIHVAEQLNLKLILAGPFIHHHAERLARAQPGWKNVDYRGILKRDGIAKVLSESSVGLCILHPLPTYKAALPIKLFEYMAAGLPVLYSDFSEWKLLVEEAQCGVAVDPLHLLDIQKKLQALLNNPTSLQVMGRQGKAAIERDYNWEVESERLKTIYPPTRTVKPVIWYLHHYAGAPSLGMSYRPYYLSKEFNRQGYQSYIIGSGYHHLLNKQLNIVDPVELTMIDEQSYIFLKTPHYIGNVKRILNILSYSWKLWRYRKKLIEITGIPSVIIVSSSHPFHYFSARYIARKYNAKLIFEVRDLWPLSFIDLLDFSPRHPLVLLMNCIERAAYRQADYVVSLLPHAFPYMNERGLTQDRFVYISNGSDTDDQVESLQKAPIQYEQLIAQKRQKGQFIIGYVGAHGIPNSMIDLIRALIILKQQGIHHIHVIMIGDGCQKNSLRTLAEAHQLDSVTFCEPVPKNQIAPILELMDAVYLGWKNKPIYNYGVSPNKLFDYMLSGKPILHAFTNPRDIVQETQSGITVEAENPEAITEGLKRLASMPKNELIAMGKNGKKAVLSQFTYAYLGKKYVALF